MQHAKKMVLISPEVLNAAKDKPKSSDATNTDRLDVDMKEILDRRDVSPYDKAQQYNQILQRYLTFYNKSYNKPLSVSVLQDSTSNSEIRPQNVSDEDQTNESSIDDTRMKREDVLSNFPAKVTKKGDTILDLIQKSKGVLDWNQQGELIKEGNVIPGSHISDLIYDAVQSSSFEPLGWEQFLDGLAKMNVPERVVTNPNRRKRLQNMKKQGWTPPPVRQSMYDRIKDSSKQRSKPSKSKRLSSKSPKKRIGRLNWEKYP